MMFKYLTLIIVMLLTWQVQAVSITVNNNKNEPMADAVVWLNSEVLSSQSSQVDTLYSMAVSYTHLTLPTNREV